MAEVWTYQVDTTWVAELHGFDVVATDGELGRVDQVAHEDGAGWLVVDTGWWIVGKKRLLPAGIIDSIDPDARKVHVRCSKALVRAAPDDDAARRDHAAFREDHESFYLGF